MPQLADELRSQLPARLGTTDAENWAVVDEALQNGHHLEPALDAIEHDSPLIAEIVSVSAELIAAAEATAITNLTEGATRFPLAELIPVIAFNGAATIITTNYDRLIELATECAGFFLDTGFVGSHYGTYDFTLSRDVLKSAMVKRGSKYATRYRPLIRLAKPHGSLDWYVNEDGIPIRSPYRVELARLMITPGASKFRLGYEQPFDRHIALANEAIDSAPRVLAIGFGFNDPHLQTHLEPKIINGLPCLILTRTLSDNARELVAKGANVIALERLEPDGGTRVHSGSAELELPESDLWQPGDFIDEVLK